MSHKRLAFLLLSGFIGFSLRTYASVQTAAPEIQTSAAHDGMNSAAQAKEEILQAQSALAAIGFDPGSVDGILGPKTRQAIMAFQRQHNLKVSGRLDYPTRTALGLSAGKNTGRTLKTPKLGAATSPEMNQHPDGTEPGKLPEQYPLPQPAIQTTDNETATSSPAIPPARPVSKAEEDAAIKAVEERMKPAGRDVNFDLSATERAQQQKMVEAPTPADRLPDPISAYVSNPAIRPEFQGRLQQSSDVLRTMMKAGDNGIPRTLLERAQGVVVIPHMMKGAIGMGTSYGKGVVARRLPNGKWSEPAFVSIGGESFGGQIGVSATDLILVFTDARALDNLGKGVSIKLGVDAGVVAGPVGRSAAAGMTADHLKSGAYAYSSSKGLFAGIALAGAVLDVDKDANQNVYGMNYQMWKAPSAAATPAVRSFVDLMNGIGASR